MGRTPGTRPGETTSQLDIRIRRLEEKIKAHEESLVIHSAQHRKTALVQVTATVLLAAAIFMATLL